MVNILKKFMHSKSYAFTLAEVLITLAIIGVVAAITISTFSNNVQVEQFRPKLKKEFSALSQAVDNLQAQNSSIDLSSGNNLVTDLGTQIAIMKKGTWSTLTSLPSSFYYKCYKSTSGTCGNLLSLSVQGYMASFITNDGALFMFDGISPTCSGDNWHAKIDASETLPQTNVCSVIYMDLNGDKGPNMLGVDFHYLYLLKKNNFYYIRPSGSNNNFSCSKDYPDDYNQSLHCTARMLMDMQMP